MAQINIYNYLGLSSDPVYADISKLKRGQSIETPDSLKVTLTKFGFYEIATENIHEGYKSLDECYQRIQELIY